METDGRRLRGDATRRSAAQAAARTATIRGLDSITVGQLATDTGLSKSGILTVFGSRENIQVAAVAEARRIYRENIIEPAWREAPGRPRLRALMDRWFDFIQTDVLPGGCFIAATSVEYGHREGPVADSVRRLKREWLDLLVSEFRAAGSSDPELDAFRVDALLSAANTRHQLFTDATELERGHRLALEVVA